MTSSHGLQNPACREVFERLSEYMDGELDAAECEKMDVHMDGCSPCQAFLESLRRTVDILHRFPGRRLEETEKRRILDAWEQVKDQQKG